MGCQCAPPPNQNALMAASRPKLSRLVVSTRVGLAAILLLLRPQRGNRNASCPLWSDADQVLGGGDDMPRRDLGRVHQLLGLSGPGQCAYRQVHQLGVQL